MSSRSVHKITKIGLTGSLGTGKSTVLKSLEILGFSSFSADQNVSEIWAVDKFVVNSVQASFPACFTAGHLDKKALRDEIFLNHREAELEAILHPRVFENLVAFLEGPTRGPGFAAEIPLLFEKGYEKHFDVILVAACSRKTQEERLLARDPTLTTDMINLILKRQMPLEEKIKKAHFVIDTERTFDEVKSRVKAWFLKWRDL